MESAIEERDFTRKGQKVLEKMVLRLKTVAGESRGKVLTYEELADWIGERTGIEINKDEFWRTAVGRYKTNPNSLVLFALACTPEFTFLDGKTRPSMDQMMQIVLGEIDGYGQPKKSPAK